MIYLVRHASAGQRNFADPDDLQRPLDDYGRSQATQIALLIDARTIRSVQSSSALRCMQTVAPVASNLGLEVNVAPFLLEGTPTSRVLEFLRTITEPTILCSHGDIIPDVIRALEIGGTRIDGRGCAKGSIWRIESDGERFTQATYTDAPIARTA